jgi:hypothetical protein
LVKVENDAKTIDLTTPPQTLPGKRIQMVWVMTKIRMITCRRGEPGLVRNKQNHVPIHCEDSVALAKKIDRSANMLKDMGAMDGIELLVSERPWKKIEIVPDKVVPARAHSFLVLVGNINTDSIIAKVG